MAKRDAANRHGKGCGMPRLSILIASDSFKGSASSSEVGMLIARGVRRVAPDARVRVLPIADGGEGTVEAVVSGAGGTYRDVRVSGPLGEPVRARYGLIHGDTAVIEMAAAAGITLVEQNETNALAASTYGVGEMILDAVRAGARKVCVGLGGSATSDGGSGMARALGVRFLDAAGAEVPCGLLGLERLARIDASGLAPELAGVDVVALTDVTNPLAGPAGAVRVYGAQKGIPTGRMGELNGWMWHYGQLLDQMAGRPIASLPGAGAAGGLGAGLVAFCGARLVRGIEYVLDAIGIDDVLQGVDLVITGEGHMDAQSANGKAPVGVAQRAKRQGIPVVAVVGGRADDLGAVYERGIDVVLPICTGPMSLAESMSRTDELLPLAGESAVRAFLLGR